MKGSQALQFHKGAAAKGAEPRNPIVQKLKAERVQEPAATLRSELKAERVQEPEALAAGESFNTTFVCELAVQAQQPVVLELGMPGIGVTVRCGAGSTTEAQQKGEVDGQP